MRKMSMALALVMGSCTGGSEPAEPASLGGPYRIVRFHVKEGSEREFERFFTESLVAAAAAESESPEALERALNGFELLRPINPTPGRPSTYYVLFRGGMRDDASSEIMRDLVRRAFPPAEAQERIERWMGTIDLESLVPRGEDFERVMIRPTGPE
jgi:hypothetical protein